MKQKQKQNAGALNMKQKIRRAASPIRPSIARRSALVSFPN